MAKCAKSPTAFGLREIASMTLAKKHAKGYPYILGHSESSAYATGFEDGYRAAERTAKRGSTASGEGK